MLQKLNQWHQTKLGLIIFGLAELILAYSFASLAIDLGNFFYYFLTLFFLVGSLQNLFKLIGKFINGKPKSNKAR